jgi:hypothetical protein
MAGVDGEALGFLRIYSPAQAIHGKKGERIVLVVRPHVLHTWQTNPAGVKSQVKLGGGCMDVFTMGFPGSAHVKRWMTDRTSVLTTCQRFLLHGNGFSIGVTVIGENSKTLAIFGYLHTGPPSQSRQECPR